MESKYEFISTFDRTANETFGDFLELCKSVLNYGNLMVNVGNAFEKFVENNEKVGKIRETLKNYRRNLKL